MEEQALIGPWPENPDWDVWRIDVDIVPEPRRGQTDAEEIGEYLSAFGVRGEVIEAHGPAGGAPVVRVFGTWNALQEFLGSHLEGDPELYQHERHPLSGSHSYSEVAARARAFPGVWVTARQEMATANLVTEIRSGRRDEFPGSEFEARSYAMGRRSDGARRYGVEVRYVDPEERASELRARIRAEVEAAVEAVLPELRRRLVSRLTSELTERLGEHPGVARVDAEERERT